jgi:hypothetical protein
MLVFAKVKGQGDIRELGRVSLVRVLGVCRVLEGEGSESDKVVVSYFISMGGKRNESDIPV